MAEITGMGIFNSVLVALSREMLAALPGIVEAAGAAFEAEIRVRAPVDTGEMVGDLNTTVSVTPMGAAATVQIESSGPGGAVHRAIFVEYGTSKMAAEPFFRPGVEAAKAEAFAIIERGVAAVIAKHVN